MSLLNCFEHGGRAEKEDCIVCRAMSSARPTDCTLRAEIRHAVDFTGEAESYLVLMSEGKSWPYLHIPEGVPDYVLDAALAKLNA